MDGKRDLAGVEHRVESGLGTGADAHPVGVPLTEEVFEWIEGGAVDAEFALDLGCVDERKKRAGDECVVGSQGAVFEGRRGVGQGYHGESQQDPDEAEVAHAGSLAEREGWGSWKFCVSDSECLLGKCSRSKPGLSA